MPVGNKVIWEDARFIAMVVRGPNACGDFPVDPSDEIFCLLRGAPRLECMEDGRRHEQVVRQSEMRSVPAPVPHSSRPSPSGGSASGAIGCSIR